LNYGATVFRIVTDKTWLAELFKPFGAVRDDAIAIDPTSARDTIWWAPGAWVARAHKAGVTLPVLSCGPRWLQNVPGDYLGRDVATLSLDSLADQRFEPEVFVKLAEAKHDSCPPRVYRTTRLAETMQQYGFPPHTLVQVQGVIEFVVEARFWVVRGEVVAESLYRINDSIWGASDFADRAGAQRSQESLCRMRELAHVIAAEVPGPPGYVVDIGMTSDGATLVIETNPSWSSGPYDGDPAAVYETIVAAHDFEGAHPHWAWQPNPIFERVEALKLLSGGHGAPIRQPHKRIHCGTCPGFQPLGTHEAITLERATRLE
jgi:hypothetical protein